jgi:hypothetical protein
VVLHSDATGANALAFVINARNPNAYFIQRQGNNFTAFLSVTPLPPPDKEGSNYHVAITAHGNTYKAVISLVSDPHAPVGTVSLEGNAAAAPYASGSLGVYEYGATRNSDGSIRYLTRFSNFSVTPSSPALQHP